MILKDELRELAERVSIVAWLRRRGDMCHPLPSWLNPARRLRLAAMSGTFFAAASLIEQGVHLAETIEDETEAIAAALRARASIKGSSDADQ